jgi:Family of unknown function (DUF6535)
MRQPQHVSACCQGRILKLCTLPLQLHFTSQFISHRSSPETRRNEIQMDQPKAPAPIVKTIHNNYPPEGVGRHDELITGMTTEHTAWDVYNNEARKVDTEFVKDWRENLNSLLLFVSHRRSDFCAFLLTILGGHFCCRTHRLHHREQDYARTGSDRGPGRYSNSISE